MIKTIFSTKFGMYEPNCGLSKIMMSWGHDEYMFQVLKHNKSTLPPQAMNIIRYKGLWSLGFEYQSNHNANLYLNINQRNIRDNSGDLCTKNLLNEPI